MNGKALETQWKESVFVLTLPLEPPAGSVSVVPAASELSARAGNQRKAQPLDYGAGGRIRSPCPVGQV